MDQIFSRLQSLETRVEALEADKHRVLALEEGFAELLRLSKRAVADADAAVDKITIASLRLEKLMMEAVKSKEDATKRLEAIIDKLGTTMQRSNE